MRWFISALALAPGLIVAPTVATADIVRSCSSGLTIAGSSVVIAKINGEGTCARKAKANQCREQASRAIMNCMKELWVGRGNNKVPDTCKGGRGAGRAVLQWNQVALIPRGNSLRDRVRWNKCCNEKNTKGRVSVRIQISGDKGCRTSGGNTFQSIDFDCARDRMNLCKAGTRAGN